MHSGAPPTMPEQVSLTRATDLFDQRSESGQEGVEAGQKVRLDSTSQQLFKGPYVVTCACGRRVLEEAGSDWGATGAV